VFGIAPENMEELLRATQAETVRSLVRTMRISQVRDMRGLDGEDMLITLNDKLSPYGIHIDSVTISNVDLPQDVAESLQRTTAFEAQQKLLEKQHVFQMKLRDDEQKLKTLAQERTNERTRCQEEAKKALEAGIEAIKAALVAGDKVQLVGFGTFAVTKKPAREGINPATKQKIKIAAKKVAKFKAGAELADAVNK